MEIPLSNGFVRHATSYRCIRAALVDYAAMHYCHRCFGRATSKWNLPWRAPSDNESRVALSTRFIRPWAEGGEVGQAIPKINPVIIGASRAPFYIWDSERRWRLMVVTTMVICGEERIFAIRFFGEVEWGLVWFWTSWMEFGIWKERNSGSLFEENIVLDIVHLV